MINQVMLQYSYKVLLIRFSSWGDVLLTLDAIGVILSNAAHAELHVLTKEKFAHVYSLIPGVKVHTISNHASVAELYELSNKLRSEEFSLVIDAHNNVRSRVICAVLARTTLRLPKFRLREFVLFAGRRIGRAVLQRPFRRAEVLCRLVAPSYTDNNLEKKNTSNIRETRVCISAESAWITKRWPWDRYLALSQTLKSQGLYITWLGLDRAHEIPANGYDEDKRGQLSIMETCEALRSASLLICNDTGLMHLSEYVGTPVLSIFGPTTKELGFGPKHKDSVVIEATKLWCRPCSKNGAMCHRLFSKQKCLTDLSVSRVSREVNDWLTKHVARDSLISP